MTSKDRLSTRLFWGAKMIDGIHAAFRWALALPLLLTTCCTEAETAPDAADVSGEVTIDDAGGSGEVAASSADVGSASDSELADVVAPGDDYPIELCTDGIDNDGDGLTDCEDDDLQYVECCNPPSCYGYYPCLMESGCNCDLAEGTCPETLGICHTNCSSNTECREECELAMGEFTDDLQAWHSCSGDLCSGTSSFQECWLENCRMEYANCFQVGLPGQTFTTCLEYLPCLESCASGPDGKPCRDTCEKRLLAEPWLDYQQWEQCRAKACSAEGNQHPNGDACSAVASRLVCGGPEIAGSCADWFTQDGSRSCQDVIDCTLTCGNAADESCISMCTQDTPAATFTQVKPVYECFLAECGTFGGVMFSSCMAEAITGPCSNAYGICLGLPPKAQIRVFHAAPTAPPATFVLASGPLDVQPGLSPGFGSGYVFAEPDSQIMWAEPWNEPDMESLSAPAGLTLESGVSYTAVLLHSSSATRGDPYELMWLEDRRSDSVAAGSAHLRFVNGALVAGEVTIAESDVNYWSTAAVSTSTAYASVPSGVDLTFELNKTGDIFRYLVDIPALAEFDVLTGYLVDMPSAESGLALYVQRENGWFGTFAVEPAPLR